MKRYCGIGKIGPLVKGTNVNAVTLHKLNHPMRTSWTLCEGCGVGDSPPDWFAINHKGRNGVKRKLHPLMWPNRTKSTPATICVFQSFQSPRIMAVFMYPESIPIMTMVFGKTAISNIEKYGKDSSSQKPVPSGPKKQGHRFFHTSSAHPEIVRASLGWVNHMPRPTLFIEGAKFKEKKTNKKALQVAHSRNFCHWEKPPWGTGVGFTKDGKGGRWGNGDGQRRKSINVGSIGMVTQLTDRR